MIRSAFSRLVQRPQWLAMMIFSVSSACGQTVQNEQLRDLIGRLEYAYYAGDARSLQRDLSALQRLALTTEPAVQQNGLNYGRWKLAQLQRDPGLAELCADGRLAPADNAQAALHEALRAACWRELELLRPLRSAVYKRQREAAVRRAQQLGGTLPQVRFSGALDSTDPAALRAVVAAYDAAQVNASALLWGHAEACFLLGQAELAAQNFLAARNALERAVLLAPDYQAAQQLLRTLSLQ